MTSSRDQGISTESGEWESLMCWSLAILTMWMPPRQSESLIRPTGTAESRLPGDCSEQHEPAVVTARSAPPTRPLSIRDLDGLVRQPRFVILERPCATVGSLDATATFSRDLALGVGRRSLRLLRQGAGLAASRAGSAG